MQVELTRFRVLPGKRELVEEWLAFLNENMEGVLLTLEREKMYVETIFYEKLDGEEYLYWYSVQGEEGENVETSDNEIDKKHLEYWKKCIDGQYKPVDLETKVVMIPKKVRDAMN